MNNLGDVQGDDAINFNIGYAAYKAENLEGAVKYLNKAIVIGTTNDQVDIQFSELFTPPVQCRLGIRARGGGIKVDDKCLTRLLVKAVWITGHGQ